MIQKLKSYQALKRSAPAKCFEKISSVEKSFNSPSMKGFKEINVKGDRASADGPEFPAPLFHKIFNVTRFK